MITRPRPMLKMPNAPICRARFCRLMASRKLGLIAETMMQRTIRRMKMPSSFFISRLSLVSKRAELSFGARCEPHYRFFAEVGAIEYSSQSPFVHHGDAIADAEHLFHLTADDNH